MKTRYIFVLILLCFNVKVLGEIITASPGDTIIVVNQGADALTDSLQDPYPCIYEDTIINISSSHSDDVATLTLAVNTVNNALSDMNTLFTVVTIIISIITVLVAVIGLFGIHDLRKEVNEHKKETNIKIGAWNTESERLKKQNEKIEKAQTLNNQYLQKVNQWMLDNAYAIADSQGTNTNQSRNLMEKSMLNYYLMKLYLSNDIHEIDGCINYIKTKGGKEEIEHLRFVVDNDSDKYRCDKAGEAIGYIQGRISSKG